MKKTLLVLSALAALASLNSVKASTLTPLPYTSGDIFAGFDNGGTNAVVVNLGLAANLTSVNLSLGSIFNTAFGNGWTNSGTFEYGVFGLNTALTGYDVTVQTGGTPNLSLSQGQVPSSTFNGPFTGQYGTDLGLGQTIGVSVWMASTEGSGWQQLATTPGTSFNFSQNILTTNIATNTYTPTLDLYALLGSTRHTAQVTTLVEQLTLTTSGQFAVTTAIPEPSTYALCGLGAVALFVAYRRRKLNA